MDKMDRTERTLVWLVDSGRLDRIVNILGVFVLLTVVFVFGYLVAAFVMVHYVELMMGTRGW